MSMSAEAVCKAALDWIINEFQLEDKNDKPPFIIGIGSGTTIIPFVNLLTEFVISKSVKPDIICVPTSEQARHLIIQNLKYKAFRLGTLDEFIEIDITIDGADAIFLNEKFIIKGGGAAHCQEKIISEASKNYIIIVADHKKLEKSFENVSVPVEILPLALNSLINLFKKEFGNDLISCMTRNCLAGSGKIGPIITDNGNLILDLTFTENISKNAQNLDFRLRKYAGVIATGVFWNLPTKTLVIYPGSENNKVLRKQF